MPDAVRLELKDDVAIVTVDRPKQLNALDATVLDALEEQLVAASKQARAIVLTGEGKAFVAGADISAMQAMGPDEARAFSRRGHALMDRIEQLDAPVIAAVNGFCLGGGLELALACDLRVASTRAVFGVPEVTLGVIPGFGGTQRLSRVCGLGPALDLVLTGRKIDAEQALAFNLVTHLVAPEELMAQATELAQTIASAGPLAIQLAKATTRRGADASLDTGNQLESEAFAACFATEDQSEGMAAFLDKRTPEFTGR